MSFDSFVPARRRRDLPMPFSARPVPRVRHPVALHELCAVGEVDTVWLLLHLGAQVRPLAC